MDLHVSIKVHENLVRMLEKFLVINRANAIKRVSDFLIRVKLLIDEALRGMHYKIYKGMRWGVLIRLFVIAKK
jgi:hypothetical protein